MNYLQEASRTYHHWVLQMEVRSFGIEATLLLPTGIVDHIFSWVEIETSKINPIIAWVERIEANL